MFGYVVVNKPELKIKDFDRYREYYCGVCHALHERHGVTAQISLSYDVAFAAVLLTALYEPKTKRLEKRCMIHPVGKKRYLTNSMIDYVSDMNLVLAYYKCLDDWEDDKNLLRLGYGNMIKKEVKRIKDKYGKKVSFIRDRIKALGEYEKTGISNIDVLSGTFGDIMGEILCVTPGQAAKGADRFTYDETWGENLRTLGFYLGKFIYILDAFDDVEKDIEKGRFNPFSEMFKADGKIGSEADKIDDSSDVDKQNNEMSGFELWVKQLLMMIAAEMAKAYERLPIVEETGILRNIIYSGIWTRYFSICERRHKDERSV